MEGAGGSDTLFLAGPRQPLGWVKPLGCGPRFCAIGKPPFPFPLAVLGRSQLGGEKGGSGGRLGLLQEAWASVLGEVAGFPSRAAAASGWRRPGAKVIRDGQVRPCRSLTGQGCGKGAGGSRAQAASAEPGRQGRRGLTASDAPCPAGAAASGLKEKLSGAARRVLLLFFLPGELFLLPSFTVRKSKRVQPSRGNCLSCQ